MANTGSEYEKYTWLEQMMKNKSNIIVTNSNTNYYKISQPEKDKKMVKIEDAPDGVVTSSTPGIYTGKQGFQVIPNWAANPDAKQTAKYLFRFALDYDGYKITTVGTILNPIAGNDLTLSQLTQLTSQSPPNLNTMYYQIAGNINILREFKEKWLEEKINKFGDIIVYKNSAKFYLYKISIEPRTLPIPDRYHPFTLKIKLTPIIKTNKVGKKKF